MKAEEVVEFARRFLQANEEAAMQAGRPVDPETAEVSGLPLFDPAEAMRAAMRSREARNDFHDALSAYDGNGHVRCERTTPHPGHPIAQVRCPGVSNESESGEGH